MQLIIGTSAVVLGSLALAASSRAEVVVYQNVNPDYELFQPVGPTEEIGDDVTLAPGTGRFITGFSVPITNSYANAFAGTFTARFYTPDADGLPGTQIWQSTLVIPTAQPSADLTLTFAAPNVTVPDQFLWTLTATTVPGAASGDESIGTTINNVPQIGSSEDFFVLNSHDGSGWGAFNYDDGGVTLANFQATIAAGAAPEPATFSTLGLVAAAGLIRRRRHIV